MTVPRHVRAGLVAVAALGLVVATGAPLHAQGGRSAPTPSAPVPRADAPTRAAAESDAPAPADAAQCLGFAFGRWTPDLDARAAGHAPFAPGAAPQAPHGRDWAAAVESGRDTTLMLFPGWWPAGVHVRLPARRPVVGDTVRATAYALVADGRVRAPTAPVRVWTVRCD